MSNLPKWAQGIDWPEGFRPSYNKLWMWSPEHPVGGNDTVRLEVSRIGVLYINFHAEGLGVKCKSPAHALNVATALIEAMEGGE